jgi:monoamine oxidase
VRLGFVADQVRWRRGHVEVRAGPSHRVVARRVLVTLPLGVLQSRPGTRGAVRFSPPIPDKIRSARRLQMGPVVKVALRFKTPFWETAQQGGKDRLTDMSFMHRRDAAVPTWWTFLPMRTRVLMGWAGGPFAARLFGRRPEAVLGKALRSLATMIDVPLSRVRSQLEAFHIADWQKDPFARGAYSWVPVGALEAVKELAQPIDGTLFFAGEATLHEGMSGTVHGAVATGWRAANEIQRSLKPSPRK